VFPDQELSREQQYAFTANFGEIERHAARSAQNKRYEVAHVISNLDSDGLPTQDPTTLYGDPPGSILPMGGDQAYKGFGLAFMIEMLARVAVDTVTLPPLSARRSVFGKNAHRVVVSRQKASVAGVLTVISPSDR
jgi:LDH2 family malate/lactate/ureidoglycolate dehydrogenase